MNEFWKNYLNLAIQGISMANNGNNIEFNTTPLENIPNSAVNDPRKDNENVRISEKYDNTVTKVEAEDTKTTKVDELCLELLDNNITIIIQKLQSDCNKLKEEQKKILEELELSRKAFETVTSELKKQLDSAKQRESEAQSKVISLRLENKKLEVLLESEKSLVEMLKKELLGVKRTLKFAIKDFYNAPRLSDTPDVGYEELENLSRTPRCGQSPRVHFADSLGNVMDSPPKNTP